MSILKRLSAAGVAVTVAALKDGGFNVSLPWPHNDTGVLAFRLCRTWEDVEAFLDSEVRYQFPNGTYAKTPRALSYGESDEPPLPDDGA